MTHAQFVNKDKQALESLLLQITCYKG